MSKTPDDSSTKEYRRWLASATLEQKRYQARSRPPSWVYFLQDCDAIKIGYSTATNPMVRLSSLQTGNPRELTWIGCFPAGSARERQLHRQFHKFHIRGEWFKDNPKLREVIAFRCPSNDNVTVVPAVEVA